MAIRNIVIEGDEILTKKSRDVTVFDEKLSKLLDDMKESMYKFDGVGLAAPQIGFLKNVIVVDDGENFYELINPKIINSSGNQYGIEGCLSCPNQFGMVDRPDFIEVTALDRNGKQLCLQAKGLLARIICHEVDHLHGKLFKEIAKELLTPKQAAKRIS